MSLSLFLLPERSKPYMSEKDNKVGLVGFTILTTVSMTDGIIMLPTMVAQVGSISIYSWIITTISVMILAFCFFPLRDVYRKTGAWRVC